MTNTSEIAREFIAHYTKGGGCANCGGLPHSTTCFVGRFQRAMSDPQAGSVPDQIETLVNAGFERYGSGFGNTCGFQLRTIAARMRAGSVPDVLDFLDRIAAWPSDDWQGVRFHAYELANRLRTLAAAPSAYEETLRKGLWVNHGCSVAMLYGDDGELQCSACLLDFKRTPLAELCSVLIGLGRLHAGIPPAAAAPSPPEAPACERHGAMVADDERGDSWHCAVCSAVWPLAAAPTQE